MKIYKDKGLTIEVDNELDLGIVDAGKSKTYKYYIVNETSNDLVDLVVSTVSSELEIIQYPIQIKAHGSSEIILKWTPSITIKKGLKASLVFKASEIIKPFGNN